LKTLDFQAVLWYNLIMGKGKMTAKSNAEIVTISRAEYERLQAQGERVSALEKQVETLMEAIRPPARAAAKRTRKLQL